MTAAALCSALLCFWHGSGTNLCRRQSATTTGATDQARVCLAAPPPASATLSVPSQSSNDGWHMLTVPEPSTWEVAIIYGGFGR